MSKLSRNIPLQVRSAFNVSKAIPTTVVTIALIAVVASLILFMFGMLIGSGYALYIDGVK